MEEQLREKERQLLQKEGNWHWRQQYQNDILNLYQSATIVLIAQNCYLRKIRRIYSTTISQENYICRKF